ncbi:MAG: ATP-binding cassette domain-containing protein [Lachnospiraceae bacterium]|nr:ATP-binding cassette domain-containing protein [Lachnospiraceae bacterium]
MKGDNGSGKSTYIKLIVNLLRPKKGSILINGTDIGRISKRSLHNSILYISQDEVLLNDSVKTYLESITGKTLSEEQLNALLEEVKFETDITEIRDGGLSLSGGQRKKLMMIKLLLGWQSSSVIILDEFENALDSDTRALASEIENLICEHREDHILFRISHLDDMRQLANIHISLGKN